MTAPETAISTAEKRDGLWMQAASAWARQRLSDAWAGSPPHRMGLSSPRLKGFAAFPRDVRPVDPAAGKDLLDGLWTLAGESIAVGKGGDPFDRASPTRGFAEALHGFAWLRDLLSTGEEGARDGLKLIADWRRLFGGWNRFSWSGEVLERRLFNLACGLGPLTERASEAEVEVLANLVVRQARRLLQTRDPAWRGAERAVVAALAAAALAGRPADRLLARAAARLDRLLPATVLPDGGHVSRSPEAGLELLFDLLALDDACRRRGVQMPEEAGRAIDRLGAGLKFFTLGDGALASFQGGEAVRAARVAAARKALEPGLVQSPAPPPQQARHSGYVRLIGRRLEVMVDAGAPAPAPWSASATAQVAAIEILCAGERLITNSGWSLRAPEAQPQRLSEAGSTVSVGQASAGAPLSGWRARALGPRLVGGARKVEVTRLVTAGGGVWLDLSEDGWVDRFGLAHERRLYLDLEGDELRGEDLFSPARDNPARVIAFAACFQLPPGAGATLARDGKSVLLKGVADEAWWLRNDAHEARIEAAAHFRDGRRLTARRIVLAGHLRTDKGGRIRWKLSKVTPGAG